MGLLDIIKSPVQFVKNTFAKRVAGTIVRKLIAGVGAILIYAGATVGTPEAGQELADAVLVHQDAIFELVMGITMFVISAIWGIKEKTTTIKKDEL